ncbi:hypothetical protein EV361DRAFT_802934 [Lentinula raphanica]|nr:hypothetical protein F5880DRAFT_1494139 [Lentinula raphanica]KAJ3969964.1 hypothetical protein EV361DRAFT_802934 [Lentinula raphanica]
MHLLFENIMKLLVLWWTGTFKDLDEGEGSFQLDVKVWEAIGNATYASGSTIPSSFGARPPNIVEDKQATTADTWSFWLLYLGPILLQDKFRSSSYHRHFCDLASIVERFLQFEIEREQLPKLRSACEEWVKGYERLYYQHDPERVSACPLTIHGLLHIPDALEEIGPIWTHWAFPTERFCGRLQPAIKSRRHPFVAIDNYIVLQAQLSQVKLIYGVEDALSLKIPRSTIPARHFAHIDYPSCILLPPQRPASTVPVNIVDRILISFATRFNTRKATIRQYLLQESISQWAKVRRLNGGDDMNSSDMASFSEDRRDATFVRYDMLIDINARRRAVAPVYEKKSFYGQLRHILIVSLSAGDELHTDTETTYILAAIERCKIIGTSVSGAPYYEQMGAIEVVDMSVVQCLVGRVVATDGKRTYIIDRTGTLQSSYYVTGE